MTSKEIPRVHTAQNTKQQGKCPFKHGTQRALTDSISISRPIGIAGFNGFYRLITNPNAEPFHGRISIPRSIFFGEAMIRVREYLSKVAIGDGNQPYCPFVGSIERRNGYYAAIFDSVNNLSEEFVLSVIDRLIVVGHSIISLRQNSRDQTIDHTAFIAAFVHCDTQEFGSMLERMHASNRLRFLSEGLMVGFMHPYHALGGRDGNSQEPMFVSEIPMFVVRRMDRSDSVFMTTPEALEIYQRYFGQLDS